MNGHIPIMPMYELALCTDKLKQTNKKGYSFLFHGLEGASSRWWGGVGWGGGCLPPLAHRSLF